MTANRFTLNVEPPYSLTAVTPSLSVLWADSVHVIMGHTSAAVVREEWRAREGLTYFVTTATNFSSSVMDSAR